MIRHTFHCRGVPMSHPCVPDVARATVVADGVATPYLCAGLGPSVLALSDSRMRLAALFRAAPRWLRLLAPEPRGADASTDITSSAGAAPTMSQAEFDRWLDGFLDALGLLVVYLVTDVSFAALALAYALARPDRVQGVASLGGAPASASDISAQLEVNTQDDIERAARQVMHVLSAHVTSRPNASNDVH